MKAVGISLMIILILSSLAIPNIAISGNEDRDYGYFGPLTLPDILPYDWTDWDRDRDEDGVDDLLQGNWQSLDGMDGRIGINVHLTHPVERGDVELVRNLFDRVGLEPVIHGVGRYSTVVYLTVKASTDGARVLPSVPASTMLEYRPVIRNFLDVSSPATRSRVSTEYSPLTAMDLGYTGEGIVIAVIDSGVDNSVHESLRGKYVYGVDFTGSTSIPGLDPDDIDGHGTHVAGTVMGTGGTTETYKGTAPDAQLVDLRYARVMGDITGNADRALEWVIENHLEYDIRVVSCSWGSTTPTSGRDTTSRLVNDLVDEGVVVVVAAGNDGSQGMSSPAAADDALTVGALHDRSTITRNDDFYDSYSNYGPRSSDGDLDGVDELKPDLIAPGRNIRAPKHNSIIDYVDKTGTSMSTPHVSGIVALMLEANPDLSPRDVKLIIRDTSQQGYDTSRPDLDPKYNYYSGWGFIDAYGAVKRAQDLNDFALYAPSEVRANDLIDVYIAGHFTKTSYDSQSDELLMELRTPGDWGMPTSIVADPDSASADYSVSGPFLLGNEWVVRARMTYNSTIEEVTPTIFTKVRPIGSTGETRTFHGSASINGIDGEVESTNSTIAYDSLPPDLSITPISIWISDTLPEGGDTITITARVNNTGSTDVKDAVVRFIDGPARTGTLIGEVMIDVPSQGYGIAEVEWEANPGIHAITVIADPDDEIDESNEDNNSAERPVSVLGFNPPPIAQLEVSPATGTTITEFRFDGSGSTDTNIRGGAVVSYDFDFGDGISTGWVDQAVVTHIYPTGGSYTASLRVKDNGGEVSTNTDEAVVNVTGVSSEEMDLYLNASLGLSPIPGPPVPYLITKSLAPVEVGTWVSDPMESSIVLHSIARIDLKVSTPYPSSIELEVELSASGETVIERDIYHHPGGGENSTLSIALMIDEIEVKYRDTLSIKVSASSNSTGAFLWAGDSGSMSHLLYYYTMNQVPQVEAGEDKDVKAGSEVMFSGTAEDLDGEIVGYRWDVDSDGVWEYESETDISFEYPGYDEEGQYTARIEVVDDDGRRVHDTLKVLVRSANYNYPPEVSIICPTGPVSGKTTIRGEAEDDDRIDRVEVKLYDGGSYDEWLEADGEEEWSFQIDTRTLENGEYTFYARAYDGDRYSAAASCEILIENPNSPPEFIRITAAPGPLPLDGFTYLLLKAEVEDPDLPADTMSVSADLSTLGGPAEAAMKDDGVPPDAVGGDYEFTLEFLPSVQVSPGIHEVIITVSDRSFAIARETVEVEVVSVTDCEFRISDGEVRTGETVFVELRVDSVAPVGEVLFISDVLGDQGSIELGDDGRNGDRVAGDSVYSRDIVIEAGPGVYDYSVQVSCTSGSELHFTEGQIEVLDEIEGIDEGGGSILILLIIAGSIVILLVIFLGIMVLNRSSGQHRTGPHYEGYVIEEQVQPEQEYPLQAVIVAEVSE